MEVRSNGNNGKFLFTWNPDINCVDIVKRGMLYRVKLYRDRSPAFKIIDKCPWPPDDSTSDQKNK